MALRLIVYDATGSDALSWAWASGAPLYRALLRTDGSFGARSWQEALEWLATFKPTQRIAQVQYWGHGKWGRALIGDDVLDAASLVAPAPPCPSHPNHAALLAMRARLTGPDALWWWRTCETFGADAGQAFAVAWANFLGCSVAGHTYTIAGWQSGLHVLAPGERPAWDATEGLAAGTAAAPIESLWSSRSAPSTIHFLSKPPR